MILSEIMCLFSFFFAILRIIRILYHSCLTKHNAEDWYNPKVAKSLPTTFYHSIRYLCINQIRNN